MAEIATRETHRPVPVVHKRQLHSSGVTQDHPLSSVWVQGQSSNSARSKDSHHNSKANVEAIALLSRRRAHRFQKTASVPSAANHRVTASNLPFPLAESDNPLA